MTIEEIKARVSEGHRVFWKNDSYEVIKDNIGQYLIKCHFNGSCIGLHGRQLPPILNGKERDFYIDGWYGEQS
jgi:hypothetical protein